MNKKSLFDYLIETGNMFSKNGIKLLKRRAKVDVLKAAIAFVISFLIGIYIYTITHRTGGNNILGDTGRYEWNPVKIIINILTQNPLWLLCMLAIVSFISAVIMYHSIGIRKSYDSKSNKYLDDTPAKEGDIDALVEKGKVFLYNERNMGNSLPRGRILGRNPNNPAELVCMPFYYDHDINDYYPNIKTVSTGNHLLFSKSGGGKSVDALKNIYQALYFGSSVMTLDPKGDYNKHLVAVCRYHHIKMWTINTENPKHSHGVDIMKMIRTSEDKLLSIMRFIESFFSVKSSGDRNNFFGMSAETMAECLLRWQQLSTGYVNRATHKNHTGEIIPAKRNFIEFMEWISAPLEELTDAISQSMMRYPEDMMLLRDIYQRSFGHKEATNNWNGMSGPFNKFDNEYVKELLSTDDIDIDAFLNEQQVINIIIDSGPGAPYSRIATIIISLLEDGINKRDPDIQRLHPVETEFDELANIEKVQNLSSIMNLARSRDVGVGGSYQNLAIFKGRYDAVHPGDGKNEWDHMLDSCSYSALLKSDNIETLEWFSTQSGRKRIVRVVDTIDKNGESVPQHIVSLEPVYPYEELKNKSDDEMLYCIEGEDGIMLLKYMAYEHPYYNIRLVHKETGEILFAPNRNSWLPTWRNNGEDFYKDYEPRLCDSEDIKAEYEKNRRRNLKELKLENEDIWLLYDEHEK